MTGAGRDVPGKQAGQGVEPDTDRDVDRQLPPEVSDAEIPEAEAPDAAMSDADVSDAEPSAPSPEAPDTEDKPAKKARKGKKKKGKRTSVIALPMSRRMQAETAQTAIKSNYHQHLTLVKQADEKAHMLITVAALVLSLTSSLLIPRLADDTRLILPVGVLSVSSLGVLTLAVLAATPRRAHRGHQTPLQVNPMFHGGFTHLTMTEYQQAVGDMLIDPSGALDDMARDIYHLGRVVERKYRYVRAAFTMLVVGMILTAVSFALAYTIPGLDSKKAVAHRPTAQAVGPSPVCKYIWPSPNESPATPSSG